MKKQRKRGRERERETWKSQTTNLAKWKLPVTSIPLPVMSELHNASRPQNPCPVAAPASKGNPLCYVQQNFCGFYRRHSTQETQRSPRVSRCVVSRSLLARKFIGRKENQDTVYFDGVTRVLTQNCTVVHATRVSTVGLITYFMASAISGRSLWSFFFPRDSSSRISAQKYLRFCVNLRDESPYHQRELRTLETPSGRQGSFATAHRVAVANEIITGLHNSARHDSRPPSKQSLIMKNICFNARRNVTRPF